MTFSGTIVDGATTYPFSGHMKNKIGKGYSAQDGYGFINAEAATAATLPVPGVASRKTHGAAGDFNIPLPINGPAGIECRSGGGSSSALRGYSPGRAYVRCCPGLGQHRTVSTSTRPACVGSSSLGTSGSTGRRSKPAMPSLSAIYQNWRSRVERAARSCCSTWPEACPPS